MSTETLATPADTATGAPANLPALRGMELADMTALVTGAGEPAYRAKQLFQWVYKHGAESVAEMTSLAKGFRAKLDTAAKLGGVKLIETTGRPGKTQKALFELADGKVIESVVMRDEGKERTSLCVSSQVGCAVGCTFCLTGFGGYQRQLTADEIAGQVLAVRRHMLAKDEQLHTIVFMGMGEPMHNLDNVVKAVKIITDPEGMGISPRRITVSTSGILPGIVAFGRAATGANIAVSLNATTDVVRDEIMPINKKWPIAQLLKALAAYPLKARQRITIEYVLLKGVNDTPDDAKRLVKILRHLDCKVNLIMFNKHDLLDFQPVDEATLNMFMKTLTDANYTASVRWSKGREIEAACGQLAAHYFQKKEAAAAS